MKTTTIPNRPTIYQYRYGVCGLSLESNVPLQLAKLRQTKFAAPDIRFTLKRSGVAVSKGFTDNPPLGTIKNGAGHPSIAVYRSDEQYLLDCHNTARRVRFVMSRSEGWIDCYPETKIKTNDIEVWLFGLVLAFFLQERGIFSLHAAAVDCNDRALVFIGHNGYGKSTLASFFLQQGHSLITDDILPLVSKNNTFFALPVCPAMNLWPQTLARVKGREMTELSGGQNITKRRYSLRSLRFQFAKAQAPLGAIYFLRPLVANDGTSLRITPIPKAKSLIDLLANTRANSMIEASKQPEVFKTYAELVTKIPVCQVEYPRGFHLLPSLYGAILDHNHSSYRADAIRPLRMQNPAVAL